MFASLQPSMITHPLVMRELMILSALCHHIYPAVSSGDQHPVSPSVSVEVYVCVCVSVCVCT